jgi:hypothetical protein
MVGDDQTEAPEGPRSCMPTEFLLVGCGASAIVYDFQIGRPVAASSATTLPRKVQHS